MGNYFVLVEEWNYPTESGREPVGITFDSKSEALDYAKKMCENEEENYWEVTGCDSLPVGYCRDDGNGTEGYIITDKKGLEPFYFFVRLLEIKSVDGNNVVSNNTKDEDFEKLILMFDNFLDDMHDSNAYHPEEEDHAEIEQFINKMKTKYLAR